MVKPNWYDGRCLARYDFVVLQIDRVSSGVVIGAMAVLASVLIAQVFSRYIFNTSLDWGWDVPRVCFIWVVLLSIPLGLKRGSHVGIDLVLRFFPPRAQAAISRFNAAVMIALMSVAAYYGAVLVFRTWDQIMPGIALSVGWFYVALVISATHSGLILLRQLVTGKTPEIGSFQE